jgi:tRNA1(Val) A37 N6-methylase TrmN6
MRLSHGQCDAHNMCNGVLVGETSDLMQKRGEQMSQEYRFVTDEMIFGPWLPITAVYCQLTDFATGNGLKAVTAYLLQ